MSKSLKIVLLAVGGFVGLLVIAAVVLLLVVDANAYKARLEATASEALGMELRVGGRLGIGFFPGVLVKLEDVHVRHLGAEIASAREARLAIDLLPLLRSKVRISRVALQHPRIVIERKRDGRFNFEKPRAAGGTLPALDLAEVSLSEGSLLYADLISGKGFEARDCALDLHRLRRSAGKRADFMKNLSFRAKVACRSIPKKDFTASDVKFSVDGKDGLFDLEPVTMHVFGAQGSGSIRADFSGAVPVYAVRYSLPQFHSEEFFRILSPQHVAQGLMDFSANLSMRGQTVHAMRQTLEGQVSLRGENLILEGNDLDEALSRFESSQNFNLVDAGAFFFAGPLGLVVTKGYNFASIFQGSGGRSEIRTLVSDWKVERGVAQAQDVAMATKENRLALHGGLDFVNQQFAGVTVALIDAKGCARVQQTIHGNFQKPLVDNPSILTSLTGPAVRLLKQGRALFPGGECEVFYAGSVAPPE